MKCPIDKSDMIVVEHEKIELDYCLRCSGVWFDSGELELLWQFSKPKGQIYHILSCLLLTVLR